VEKSDQKIATCGRSTQPLVKQIHWVVYDESTETMLFIYVVYLTVMIYLFQKFRLGPFALPSIKTSSQTKVKPLINTLHNDSST